jgi:hypothetical protein
LGLATAMFLPSLRLNENLTFDMIEVTAKWLKDGPKGPLKDEWTHPLSRGPAQDAERVRKWWLHKIGKALGEEAAKEFGGVWEEAFKNNPGPTGDGFAEGLNAAIAQYEARPQPQPEAKPKREEIAKKMAAFKENAFAEEPTTPALAPPKVKAKPITVRLQTDWPDAPLPPPDAALEKNAFSILLASLVMPCSTLSTPICTRIGGWHCGVALPH